MYLSLPKPRALLLCLLACALCWVAPRKCDAQDLRYLSSQAWTTEDGLPQNSVHAIAQTSDGFLWAATEAGLVRFDGVRFDVFSRRNTTAFASDDLCCLLAGRGGGLWIGTSDGLIHLQRGKFTRFSLADGLPSTTILALAARDDGSLDVTTPALTSQWPTGDDKVQPSDHPKDAWSWTTSQVALQGGSPAWRAGRELPAGRVVSVFRDRNGLGWVAMSSGLVVIDPARKMVTPVPGFSGASILDVFQDREGSYWIGTESSGLHLLRRLRFRGIAGLAGKAITSVAGMLDGTTWVGTRDEGVYRVVDGKVDQPVPVRALTSGVILALQPAADGGLWVGTPDGLNRIDKTGRVQRITSADGLPDDYVRSLMDSPDGSVWVGTRHGLVHIAGKHLETLTSIDGLGGDLIGALLPEPGGGLWVATSGGLSRVGVDGKIRNFAVGEGLATPIVTALGLDPSQRLWAVTDDGTFSVLESDRFGAVTRLRRDERASNNVQAVSFDSAGSLWVRMDRDILRIGSAQLNSCLKQSPCTLDEQAVAQYGPADGLRNDEVVPRATAIPWMAANGELWFPTRAGIAIAQTKPEANDTDVMPVAIERMLVDDAAVDLSQSHLQLPFGRQRLTMEYAGLSFLAPGEMHFRYRLQGFDPDWVDAGNRRSVTYTNLAPGSYTFYVTARNNDADWSVVGAMVRFQVVPPLYRRLWFLLLMGLLLAATVAGIYLLRLRHLRNRFDAVLAERNRMAREIHDTLTQDFVSTSLQLDIVAQQLKRGQVEKAVEQVRQARQLVTEGLEEARRSIWELRANQSQDTLPTRLSRLVQREALAAIHPEVKVRGAYRVLDPRVEREVLRIANEALMNAMKHSGAQHTSVDLYYSSEALLLTILDDGAGFDVDKASHKEGHYGLVGMRERASLIEGTLEILSQPGQGTTVRLRVPLETK